MDTHRKLSYFLLDQDTTSQTPLKPEHDDGSQLCDKISEIAERITTTERRVINQGYIVDSLIREYQKMKKESEEEIKQLKLLTLNLLREEEEKTKEKKKLNLLVYDTQNSRIRDDDETALRVENIFTQVTKNYISVHWATQLDIAPPGMVVTRVRFYNENDKNMVFSAKEKFRPLGIYIEDDLTISELKREKEIDVMTEEAMASAKVTSDSRNGKKETSV